MIAAAGLQRIPANKNLAGICSIIFSALFTLYAQSEIISDFKNTSTTCDYLIICPSEFLSGAQKLAAHRNAYKTDDVEKAMVVTLAALYNQFPVSDTLPKSFSLWYAIKFAREQWLEKPEYVVLLGDDSVVVSGFDTLSAPPKSAGLMPTFYLRADSGKNVQEISVDYLDQFYLTVSDSVPPITRCANAYLMSYNSLIEPFALGRIPARTNNECSRYIDKVIRYDTLNQKGAWFNNVQLSADDANQGTLRDPLFPILLQSSERVEDSTLHGFFIHKTYLSSFIKSSTDRHENAKKDFFSAINRGVRWSAYFGHGKNDYLADEFFLENSDTALFANDTTPFIMFSFSCSNGDFLRKPEATMGESFLLKPSGGCIAYFAATVPTYAFENEDLAKVLFNQSTLPQQLSLGKAVAAAYPSCQASYYAVLGDPAILFSKPAIKLSTQVARSVNNDITISSSVQNASFSSFRFTLEVARRDSVTCLDDSSVSYSRDSILMMVEGTVNGTISSILPATLDAGTLHYSLYVWSNYYEGRIDTTIIVTSPVVQAPSQKASKPLIRFNRGVLSLSLPSPAASGSISLLLVDMRGVQVNKSTIACVNTQPQFDLNKLGIAKGNYFFHINAENQKFTGKVCFMR